MEFVKLFLAIFISETTGQTHGNWHRVPKDFLENLLAYGDALNTARGVLFSPKKTAGRLKPRSHIHEK
jgi:hypothetical protein